MTRRDYVSFLGERRRDITFGNRGPDPTRWVLLVVAVLAIAVSVYWFGFRDVDRVIASERILNDTTVPTLLTPTALEGLGADAVDVDLSCPGLVEEWTTFQGSPTRSGCVSTRMIVRPKILWSVETGILGWRNSPVIENGAIFVGSAGVLQSAPDRRDGIYSIDLGSGTQRWFYTTELDVNSVAVNDGIVIGTGDEGRVWALSARDGSLLWTDDGDVPVFADPLFYGEGLVVIADGAGTIRAYDIRGANGGGAVVWDAEVDGAVRGGVSSDGDRIYVAGENGEVLVLSGSGQIVWRASVQTRIPGAADARIFGAPTVTDTMVIVSLVRNDIFAEPALVALDKEDGTEIWRAKDSASIKNQWANIRSSPAIAGDYLVFGEGYSKDLVVVDLATGETVWSYQTQEFCYPHWPSVAVNSGPETAQAYLARQDGALYAVDLSTRELAWQIYLGDADGTGAFPASYGDGAFCQWAPTDGYSILASPAISPEGVIVIGTLEGYMMAIGDADW